MTAFLGFVSLTSPVCIFSLLKTPVKGQADFLVQKLPEVYFSKSPQIKGLIQ
jgi:hypothetical protein